MVFEYGKLFALATTRDKKNYGFVKRKCRKGKRKRKKKAKKMNNFIILSLFAVLSILIILENRWK